MEIADLAVVVLFCAVALGHALRGPSRSVKIMTAVLVVGFAWRAGVHTGSALLGLGAIAWLVGVAVFSMAVGMLAWREPARLELRPAGDDAVPAFAREQVDTSTRAAQMLGLRHAGDWQSTWSMGGQERTTFIRMFSDEDGWVHASQHVLTQPRVVARQLLSMGTDGTTRITCNLQHNAELLSEPRTRIRRVPRDTSWDKMLEEHRAWALADAERSTDVKERAVRAHDAWVERLVAEGTAAVKDGQVAIRIARVPITVARVVGAWFS